MFAKFWGLSGEKEYKSCRIDAEKCAYSRYRRPRYSRERALQSLPALRVQIPQVWRELRAGDESSLNFLDLRPAEFWWVGTFYTTTGKKASQFVASLWRGPTRLEGRPELLWIDVCFHDMITTHPQMKKIYSSNVSSKNVYSSNANAFLLKLCITY